MATKPKADPKPEVIKIEKGIAIPVRSRPSRLPLAEMKVDDSILIPADIKHPSNAVHSASRAMRTNGKLPTTAKFITAKVDTLVDGKTVVRTRCWRKK